MSFLPPYGSLECKYTYVRMYTKMDLVCVCVCVCVCVYTQTLAIRTDVNTTCMAGFEM